MGKMTKWIAAAGLFLVCRAQAAELPARSEDAGEVRDRGNGQRLRVLGGISWETEDGERRSISTMKATATGAVDPAIRDAGAPTWETRATWAEPSGTAVTTT
jgi:hypothetical protein